MLLNGIDIVPKILNCYFVCARGGEGIDNALITHIHFLLVCLACNGIVYIGESIGFAELIADLPNAIFVNPSYDEQYSVTFTTTANYDTTVTINIKCKPCSELFIPTAFTPNGDGLNDVFTAQSKEEYSYFEMTIYSGNGQVLFVSKDIKQGWDGTYKGTLQPHGAYLYIIRYKDFSGKMNEKRGNLLLLLH